MTSQGNRPGRAGRGPRSRLDDREERLARKRRQATTGIVTIPGPLSEACVQEIQYIAARVQEREVRREIEPRFRIEPLGNGLSIETSSEKLAQHIADALERSRHAEVERRFDDEGNRRMLTVRLPTGAAE